MADDKASVTLTELRHPDNEIPGGFAQSSLFPSVEGSAYRVKDNPVNGKGGVDEGEEELA
jgi:hypothetical protein